MRDVRKNRAKELQKDWSNCMDFDISFEEVLLKQGDGNPAIACVMISRALLRTWKRLFKYIGTDCPAYGAIV